MTREHRRERLLIRTALVLATLSGCGDDDTGSTSHHEKVPTRAHPAGAAGAGTEQEDDSAPADNGPCGAGKFDSTFAAIQKVIFEGRKCTNDKCHGAARSGGLDLRADGAYENLLEVESKSSPLYRVMPGEPDESFLYNKLRAATEPGSVQVEGSPMPSGAPALSPEHLEVVRRWIEAGAPREGSVGDSVTGSSDGIAKLLGSCLPEATPLKFAPLAAPAPDEGIQFMGAPLPLRAGQEIDVCWAQYYDVSDVVPAKFQDKDHENFFINGRRTRQDAQSHHLVVAHSGLGAEYVDDPSFGEWTCRGEDRQGETCDPLEPGACGSSVCASEVQGKPVCNGFGPPESKRLFMGAKGFSTAQTAQYYQAPRDGVYETIPLRGIVYWNSHAFNLTNEDTQLHAWINLFYAADPKYEIQTLPITNNIYIAAGQAPFTEKHYCATWVAPLNSEMYTLGSHTHKRGRNFTVELADGTQIYQNFYYSDPIEKIFDPPMRFDSEDPQTRTLTYCADFNNGVLEDGSPDVDLVTRLSTMPDRTTCAPVGCVAGKTGAACPNSTDAECDSSPGAGDGWCDACPITAGQTTENEMFVLSPSIVMH
jgi:hypothetical protein